MPKIFPFDPAFPDGKHPDGSFSIREDQEQKIQRAIAEPTKGVLIADDMGKGKTLMGTEIVLRLGLKRVLIVGIRDVWKQWAKSFDGQSDGRVKLRVMNSSVPGEKEWEAFMAGEPGVYYCGIQWLTSKDWGTIYTLNTFKRPIRKIDKKTGELILKDRPQGKIGPAQEPTFKTQSVHKMFLGRRLNTKGRHVDMVMFDEVHKMQNRKSHTARSVSSIKPDWRVGLSGTFMGNNFQGAWKVCLWIWGSLIDSSFVRWRRRWAELYTPTLPGGLPITDAFGNEAEKVVGEKNEGEFVKTLPCYIRDEPEPVPEPRILKAQLTERQREQYTSMEKVSLAWLDAHTPIGREPLIADLPITQRQRLRTMALGEVSYNEDMEIGFNLDAASAKLNVTKYVVDKIWTNQPILIGCYSVPFAVMAAERFRRAGYGAIAYHGGLTSKERDRIKEGFIASDPSMRYLITTIPSIGTGTDGLQLACSKAIWLEESENRTDNKQFIKRIFRDGMTTKYGPFEHLKILAEGTLDEGIMYRHDSQNRSMSTSLRAA